MELFRNKRFCYKGNRKFRTALQLWLQVVFFILFKSAFSSELLFAVFKVLCIEVQKLLNVFAAVSGSTTGLPSSSLIKFVHDLVDLPVRACKVFQRYFGLLLLLVESKYNFDFEFRIEVLTLFLQSVY